MNEERTREKELERAIIKGTETEGIAYLIIATIAEANIAILGNKPEIDTAIAIILFTLGVAHLYIEAKMTKKEKQRKEEERRQ